MVRQKGKAFDCVIIGAGPGGLTAGLYLRRFRRNILVVSGGKPRAAWIPKTKNLIGYQGGISGKALLQKLKAQLAELKCPIVEGEAKVQKNKNGFKIEMGSESYTAKTVILATGIEDKQPVISGLPELRKMGLLRYCPVCDGFEYIRKKLILLVNSSHCFEKVFFLSQYSRHITVIAPSRLAFPAKDKAHCKRMKIKIVEEELLGIERHAKGIIAKMKGGRTFKADAAYVELGFKVRDHAFAHLCKLDRCKDGRINVDSLQRTNIKGLFAVGDCVSNLAQISVAAGHAAVAATEVHNELLQRLRRGGA